MNNENLFNKFPDARVEKALEHERNFGKKQDTDIIKKRMDSDLFKSKDGKPRLFGGRWA